MNSDENQEEFLAKSLGNIRAQEEFVTKSLNDIRITLATYGGRLAEAIFINIQDEIGSALARNIREHDIRQKSAERNQDGS